MENKAQDDDLVMSLVELALDQPEPERRAFLQRACAGDPELFNQAWEYVQWETRMRGFLLDPLFPPPLNEHPFEPGELLDGRFRILREVAQGGMGVVYEAMDERLDRRIAIKCGKTGFRKRLPPEVRNAREISHPNVCKIFEIHTASTRDGDLDFLSMEFLEGETLAERLRRGGLTEPEARVIARQLCEGLAEAHRNQVIHGDLKSNNIILTVSPDGATRAVITDFGMARRPESSQRTMQTGPRGGTPDYMAPELWKGEKASTASDIYALGVILYELVSGRRPPQPDESSPNAFPPPAVHPKWDRTLARCLEPDPQRRFHSAEVVARTFEPSHARRWVLAAAAAVLLAVASAALTYQRATPPKETIRLAVLPFDTDGATRSLSQGLLLDLGERLSHVKAGRARLTLIPLSDALQNKVTDPVKARTMLGATHALHGMVRQENGRVSVQAYLTDARSQIRLNEWRAEYPVGEVQNMPVALAGMVTGALRLPPLFVAGTVNAKAYRDWAEGVSLARGDPGGVDHALELLERATSADPNSALTHAKLAEAEWLKYELTSDDQWSNRARESLKNAEQRNPDVVAVRFASGLINDSFGRYDQALADLLRAIEIEPMNGDVWRQLGTVYQHSDQPNPALAAFQKAVELQPAYFKNYRALGAFYYDRYDFAEAVRQYQKMVDVAPSQPDAHFKLSNPYLNMGRYSDAEHELRLAISLRETSDAMHGLAVSLMYQDRDPEAIPYYLRALELGPPPNNKYLLYLNLGTSYRRSNQPVEATRAYRKALELAYGQLEKNPKDGYVRSCLAYLNARLGGRQEAESNAVQASGLSRGDLNVSWMAALTYEALGDRDRTLSLVRDAPEWFLSRLNRFPDLADLQKDLRFQQLMLPHHIQ
jgi:eukaryotic-like serine/threonine-protein kinase